MDALGPALVAAASVLAAASAFVLAGAPAGALRPRGRAGVGRARAATALGRAREWACGLAPVRRARGSEALARRRRACLDELPALLDVVTLGLSAGLSFDASLALYCERYDGELSRAFSEAMLRWRIGVAGREGALRAVADELGVSALGRFASVVAEALAFGTPLAEALERQAQVIRDEQRARVEEEIERVPVKMLVPLGTLIVPAMFLAILGPLLGSAMVAG